MPGLGAPTYTRPTLGSSAPAGELSRAAAVSPRAILDSLMGVSFALGRSGRIIRPSGGLSADALEGPQDLLEVGLRGGGGELAGAGSAVAAPAELPHQLAQVGAAGAAEDAVAGGADDLVL